MADVAILGGRRGWKRAGLAIAAGVVLLILGLVLVAALESRFGPIDPTDPGWKAEVVNDVGQPVHVKNSAEDLVIAAGQSDILVSPGPGQRHVVFTVSTASGQVLGCLPVDLDPQRTLRVNASSMRPC